MGLLWSLLWRVKGVFFFIISDGFDTDFIALFVVFLRVAVLYGWFQNNGLSPQPLNFYKNTKRGDLATTPNTASVASNNSLETSSCRLSLTSKNRLREILIEWFSLSTRMMHALMRLPIWFASFFKEECERKRKYPRLEIPRYSPFILAYNLAFNNGVFIVFA